MLCNFCGRMSPKGEKDLALKSLELLMLVNPVAA
jgi:hypothetical protein